MLREAYKVQNINNKISKKGLIRMYKNLLAEKKIEYGGCAHRRLIKMMYE
tara:strand:- start:1730 stop:1879 length:150 start_codon:yes stop_codon:yes gene_type:complete